MIPLHAGNAFIERRLLIYRYSFPARRLRRSCVTRFVGASYFKRALRPAHLAYIASRFSDLILRSKLKSSASGV
jgi:hypothetical protein